MILKRTSHIFVTLKEKDAPVKAAPKAKEEPKEEKSEKEEVR